MTLQFANEREGKDVLAEVRSDKSDTNWCLFSYEGPNSQKITLIAKGSGGLSELASNLRADIVGYGLVRKTDQIDDSTTVKFAFINFLGENVPRMQKARISVHSGAIRDFIGQYHVDISTSTIDELTDENLQQKIMDTSGSGSRVLDKTTGQRVGGSSIRSSPVAGAKVATSGSLTFGDEAGLKATLKEVRTDASVDWVLTGYEGGNSNNIVLLAKGSGGAEEFLANITDDLVGYGLIKKTEQIDDSQTIKFCFIRFVGDNIPRMLRARIGTHTGAIQSFFAPYHVDLDVTRKDEVSDEIIMNKIKAASGTKDNVLAESRGTAAPTRVTGSSNIRSVTPSNPTSSTAKPVVPKTLGGEQGLKLSDNLKDLIRDVRNDATDTDWCLVGYEGGKGNTIVPIGSGSGGVNELLSHLQDNIVAYGLVRKTEKIDESLTVKFAFINWVGENIDRMHRARLGTHKGQIQELFAPYHTDVNATTLNEISDEIIQQRISDASGKANKVKN